MAEEKNEFKVTDRRIFGADGQLQEPSQSKEPELSFSDAAADLSRASSDFGKEKKLPEMNFQMLIISLSTSALVQLGIAPNPANGKTEQDLITAKQTIDILGILQEKTKGNLTSEESRLLDQCLYDLKLSYLSLVQK